jgi:hypothetical protein
MQKKQKYRRFDKIRSTIFQLQVGAFVTDTLFVDFNVNYDLYHLYHVSKCRCRVMDCYILVVVVAAAVVTWLVVAVAVAAVEA